MTKGLPRRVQDFVRVHLDSVELLEVLMLLLAQPETAFSAERVSDQLGTATHSARSRLRRLQAKNLVEQLENDWFRLSGGRDLAVTLAAVSEAYRDRPSDIVALIDARPSQLARVLTDAFKAHGESGTKKET